MRRATTILATLALAALLPAAAGAQEWETSVTVEPVGGVGPEFLDPSLGPIEMAGPSEDEEVPQARVITADELPRALTYEEADALRQRASAATLPVVASFRRDPLLTPNLVEVRGALTAIESADGGEPLLVTASYLVEGAEVVVIETPAGPVEAEVEIDRNLGLATLRPRGNAELPVTPLTLAEDTDANSQEEGFTTTMGGGGATLGAAEGEYGYYQLNTLGAVLGYPILNRDGEIVGIGSHRYPPSPNLSLSIPADKVEEYLQR